MLEGTRVVEMGLWVAGPAAGGIFADWGADVIKLEPPAGDPMRWFFRLATGSQVDRNPPFALDNRGKRSVALDLRDEHARRAAERIIAGADVFLTNMRPEALARLGFDHESLCARHPKLVYASVTGYGLSGAERNRPGYDVGAFWARTGVADTLRTDGAAPPALRGGFGDHITAITAVSGILAALHERTRTGKGRVVEISLLRTGMYCIGWDLSIQLEFDKIKRPVARNENEQPLVNCYEAGDGRWFWLIGLEADRHFPGIARAIGRPELCDDPRFAKVRDQRRNRGELIAILDETFAAHPLADWAERFDSEGVWWAPVQSPAEVVCDPQAQAAGAFVDVAQPDGSTSRSVATPVTFHGRTQSTLGVTPNLGEHTEAVLREVGLDENEIDVLRSSGAIPQQGTN